MYTLMFLQAMPVSQPLQRKKSLPDVQAIPIRGEGAMSREEVSVLSSARREEVRRQIEEAEKLKANPLLWLVSPQVKVSTWPAYFLNRTYSEEFNHQCLDKRSFVDMFEFRNKPEVCPPKKLDTILKFQKRFASDGGCHRIDLLKRTNFNLIKYLLLFHL